MKSPKIAVIGLGYVGLPLALAFAKHFTVVGFDVSARRVQELNAGIDGNNECSVEQLASKNFSATYTPSLLTDCTVYIVTVPTPVHEDHKPDLTHLINASRAVGEYLKRGDLVIYESTVYPGVTEDECLPILEQASGLRINQDFGLGYSPERINPGDKDRPLEKIVKITSGSSADWSLVINELYSKVIDAGTHLAPSIRVAEAAKVIENTQRDLNIALVNQLAQLFTILDIDTRAVLEAASTKWNFLPFKPGLVGGHCIGVDPYYLCHKAETVGYIPDIILAGRRLNDSMAIFVAQQIVKAMSQKGIGLYQAEVLILGMTFKENCPDSRNTKVVNLVKEIENFACKVSIYDPLADKEEIKRKFDVGLIDKDVQTTYDSIVLAVPHDRILKEIDDFVQKLKPKHLIYDLKGVLSENYKAMRL